MTEPSVGASAHQPDRRPPPLRLHVIANPSNARSSNAGAEEFDRKLFIPAVGCCEFPLILSAIQFLLISLDFKPLWHSAKEYQALRVLRLKRSNHRNHPRRHHPPSLNLRRTLPLAIRPPPSLLLRPSRPLQPHNRLSPRPQTQRLLYWFMRQRRITSPPTNPLRLPNRSQQLTTRPPSAGSHRRNRSIRNHPNGFSPSRKSIS